MFINWLLIKKTKCSKSIPGFSISRLANVEDFFNVNIFFKCKYVRISNYSFKYVYLNCVVCCLKIPFYCLTFSEILNLNSVVHSTKQSAEILILEIEMLVEFQNKTNINMMGANQCILDLP